MKLFFWVALVAGWLLSATNAYLEGTPFDASEWFTDTECEYPTSIQINHTTGRFPDGSIACLIDYREPEPFYAQQQCKESCPGIARDAQLTIVCIGLTYPSGNCKDSLVMNHQNPQGLVVGKCACESPEFNVTTHGVEILAPKRTENTCDTWHKTLEDVIHGKALIDSAIPQNDDVVALINTVAQLSGIPMKNDDVLPAWIDIVSSCCNSFTDVTFDMNQWYNRTVRTALNRGLDIGRRLPNLNPSSFLTSTAVIRQARSQGMCTTTSLSMNSLQQPPWDSRLSPSSAVTTSSSPSTPLQTSPATTTGTEGPCVAGKKPSETYTASNGDTYGFCLDTDFPGGDTTSIVGIGTPHECADACSRNPSCVAGNIALEARICYLKDVKNPATVHAGVDGVYKIKDKLPVPLSPSSSIQTFSTSLTSTLASSTAATTILSSTQAATMTSQMMTPSSSPLSINSTLVSSTVQAADTSSLISTPLTWSSVTSTPLMTSVASISNTTTTFSLVASSNSNIPSMSPTNSTGSTISAPPSTLSAALTSDKMSSVLTNSSSLNLSILDTSETSTAMTSISSLSSTLSSSTKSENFTSSNLVFTTSTFASTSSGSSVSSTSSSSVSTTSASSTSMSSTSTLSTSSSVNDASSSSPAGPSTSPNPPDPPCTPGKDCPHDSGCKKNCDPPRCTAGIDCAGDSGCKLNCGGGCLVGINCPGDPFCVINCGCKFNCGPKCTPGIDCAGDHDCKLNCGGCLLGINCPGDPKCVINCGPKKSKDPNSPDIPSISAPTQSPSAPSSPTPSPSPVPSLTPMPAPKYTNRTTPAITSMPSTTQSSNSTVRTTTSSFDGCALVKRDEDIPRIGPSKKPGFFEYSCNGRFTTHMRDVTTMHFGQRTAVIPDITCSSSWSQACAHYSSVLSVSAARGWDRLTCGPAQGNSKVDRIASPIISQWNSEHASAWLSPKYRKEENCQRDEYPPAYFFPDTSPVLLNKQQLVRYLPGNENGGAGSMWKQFCYKHGLKLASSKDWETKQAPDRVERTQGADGMVTTWAITKVSVSISWRPVFSIATFQLNLLHDQNDYGLGENPCIPDCLVDDPLFALLEDDPQFKRFNGIAEENL